MMTRRLAVVAAMLVCMVATPALARHQKITNVHPAGDCQMDNNGRVLCSGPRHESKIASTKVHREQKIATARTHRLAASAASKGLVTVPTAAGIDITVSREFEPKIVGFIGDLVARGYHPKRIHCYAADGHVRGSLHYSGNACDFDQHCWGCTARTMYHVADLAAKWGLRDGGEFRDWGHIDSGDHLHRSRFARAWPRTSQ